MESDRPIFAIGLSTAIYTVFGGVQAVTWTDVKQMIVIFFGLGVCFVVILWSFPTGVSLGHGLHLAGRLGKLNMVDTTFDLKEKYTNWSGLIGGLFLMLGYFGCDQSSSNISTRRKVNSGLTNTPKEFTFNKDNLKWMVISVGVTILGYVLMMGGKMPNNDTWDESIIYSFTRTVISPIVILSGLGLAVYSIFRNQRTSENV